MMEFVAPACAALTLLVLAADKLFGSGRALAKEMGAVDKNMSALDKNLSAEISQLRIETNEKRETNLANVGEALNGLRTQMHMAEKQMLEFRAFSAETYMRRDAYYTAAAEIKRDMKEGFERVELRLERMEKNGH